MALPSGFEPVLHPPTRLQIAALLANVSEAEFARIRTITGVSDSVLSKHLAALAEADLIVLNKAASDGRQRTWARITGKGRSAFKRHVAALEVLVATAKS
jgi:DNA-binding transcriptional ArsR family regulator